MCIQSIKSLDQHVSANRCNQIIELCIPLHHITYFLWFGCTWVGFPLEETSTWNFVLFLDSLFFLRNIWSRVMFVWVFDVGECHVDRINKLTGNWSDSFCEWISDIGLIKRTSVFPSFILYTFVFITLDDKCPRSRVELRWETYIVEDTHEVSHLIEKSSYSQY